MPPGKSILLLDDNTAFGAALSSVLGPEYVIETSPNTYDSVLKSARESGAKRHHAILLDANSLSKENGFGMNGIFLVDSIRTELKSEAQIVLFAFSSLEHTVEERYCRFLRRKGYSLVLQPFLLRKLLDLLVNAKDCDLDCEMRCFKIARYSAFVRHEFLDKLEWTAPCELKRLWDENRGDWVELGGFDAAIRGLDDSQEDKRSIGLAVENLLEYAEHCVAQCEVSAKDRGQL